MLHKEITIPNPKLKETTLNIFLEKKDISFNKITNAKNSDGNLEWSLECLVIIIKHIETIKAINKN